VDEISEEGVSGSSGGPKQLSLMPVMILLILVCILMAANLYVSMTRKGGSGGGEAKGKGPVKAVPWEAPEEMPTQFTTTDGVVVMKVELEMAGEAPAKTLTEHPGRVADVFVSVLETKKTDEVTTEAIKEEIKEKINKMLGIDDQVVEVNFLQFQKQKLQ